LYAKIHHSALDGQGGVAVAQALLDAEPKPRAVSRPEKETGSHMKPSTRGCWSGAAQYGRAIWKDPEGRPVVAKAAGRAGAVAITSSELRKRGIALGPRTKLNAAIGPQRAFVSMQIPLAEAKAIARHFEAKLNDVVLALCAAALRKQSRATRRPWQGDDRRVPVSLRAPATPRRRTTSR